MKYGESGEFLILRIINKGKIVREMYRPYSESDSAHIKYMKIKKKTMVFISNWYS